MKMNGRLLGGVGLLVVACAGTNLTEVGELNDAKGGSGAQAGSKNGGSTKAGNDGRGAEGGIDGVGALGGDGGVPPLPRAGSGNIPQGGRTPVDTGDDGAGAGGYYPQGGNSPYVEPDNEPDPAGTVVYEASSTIFAVAADETTLYWVEYGTTDELGNYNNDGRLLARDFDSEDERVIADELPGAVSVELTSEHAYVAVDQYYDGGPRNALLRVALTGSTPEAVLVQQGGQDYATSLVCEACFVHDGDTGYFAYDSKIYRITPTANAAEVFADLPGNWLAAGNERLYVSNKGVWAIPYATGTPSQLTTSRRTHIAVNGSYLYGVENDVDVVYLARMPLSGGNWVRRAPERDGLSFRLQELDGLFFQDIVPASGNWQVLQGHLDNPTGAVVALELPRLEFRRDWVGTHSGIFWNDGRLLRHTPLVVE